MLVITLVGSLASEDVKVPSVCNGVGDTLLINVETSFVGCRSVVEIGLVAVVLFVGLNEIRVVGNDVWSPVVGITLVCISDIPLFVALVVWSVRTEVSVRTVSYGVTSSTLLSVTVEAVYPKLPGVVKSFP